MATFTTRKGKIIEVKDFVIPASEMVSILRLKEDFAVREEYLATYGVVVKCLEQGIKSIRHHWKAADKLQNKNEFAKAAARLFDAKGQVVDTDALAKLAIKHGFVKGTPVELSNSESEVVEDEYDLESTEEVTEEVAE